jgi:UPF0755 protein
MRSFLLAAVSLMFVCILGATGYVLYVSYSFLKSAPEDPGQEVLFHVEPGDNFDKVAKRLEEQGLITNLQYFRLYARYKKQLESIQAGEFMLNTGWPPPKVLETLVSGRPILYRLALREGLTWWETAKVVDEAGHAEYGDFAATIKDPELLRKYDIPFDSAEGFLFPETYLLQRPRTKDARPIVEMLLKTFWENAKKVWPGERPSPEELRRIVILASLVEKETGAPEERARVAGVFAKRLEKRMLLQCDPTTIYGLGLSFDGNLRRKHLNDPENPYNTYQHPGLPPGPICSPGLDSLLAAKNPEDHDYLYFVSMKDGTHYFSKTLREHNNAVRKYQLGR